MKGRADLALPAFEKANRLAPSFADGHLLLARSLLLSGRTEDVSAAADRAMKLAVLAKDAPRASDAYVVAAEAAPANVSAHAVLAAIDALRGRANRPPLRWRPIVA